MTLETRPLEVLDFGGGITDNYLDGDANRYREADNFIIQKQGKLGKLITREGSDIYDASNPQIPLGSFRIGALQSFRDELLVQASTKLYYIDGSFQNLLGEGGNDIYSVGTADNYPSFSEWNNHLFTTNDAFSKVTKIFKDNGGNLTALTAGLPGLSSAPSIAVGAAGANNFLYAFIYAYTYSVENLSFKDESAITIVEVTNSDDPSTNANSISAIPVLANGAGDNYDTANVKVEIYRTINGGTTFYKLGEVNNGITVFSDNQSDAVIQANNITLYNTGGSLDKEAPPLCKYIHTTNNFTYFAYLKEGSAERSNVIQQSFRNDGDSTNTIFRAQVDDEITGLNSYNFTPLVFCESSVYRLDDNYTNIGTGQLVPQKISDTIGCLSNRSIVRTAKGTFFAGNDGFYWTDAFRVKKVSAEFDERYLAIARNAPEKIYGVYNDLEDRIYWAVKKQGSSADNDYLFVLDLRFGIKEDMPFTTWSGGDSFAPSAMGYFQDTILRADRRGYLFKHQKTLYTDPKVNTSIAASNWEQQAIVYNYESCAYRFGSSFTRKWIPRILVTADNETNLSLQINSINDDGKLVQSLKPITFNGALIWGDPDFTWGDQDITWNFDGIIEQWRRFAAKGLRCSYKQVQFTNAKVEIDTSAVSGKATINSGLSTATLDNGNSQWPSASVDYFLKVETDNFNKEFLVTSRTPTTIVVQDTDNDLLDGSFDWKMCGVPKGQVLHLHSYTIHYAFLGKTQEHITGDS